MRFTLACWIGLSSAAAAQTEILRLTGAAAHDSFGAAIAFVGDVDGDGHSDFAIGAPRSNGATADTGRVTVYSGRNSQALYAVDGVAGSRYFGCAIAGVGDVDGDGLADMLIGAGGESETYDTAWQIVAGYAQLLSGASAAPLLTFSAPPNIQRFGYAVAGGHDFTGDGVGELLIGAPGDGDDPGYVYVFDGASGAQIRRDGDSRGLGFGFALEFLDDLNADGIAEYAVGAPAAESYGYTGNGFNDQGWLFAVDGASGLVLWAVHDIADSQLGWCLARIDDVTADGYADLAVGARGKGGSWIVCTSWSKVQVRSGANGALVRAHADISNCSAWGSAVAACGDLDGDGKSDYAGGGPGWMQTYDFAEGVRCFGGTSGALVASVLSPLANANGLSLDSWGYALASGDTNGDGLADLLIGAPYADDSATNAGTVYVQTIVRSTRAYCTASVNSQGCSPSIAGTGTPSATSGLSFTIGATNVLNQKLGILFYGFAPQALPFLGGQRCVAAPSRRTPSQSSNGNPPPDDCSGYYAFDFNAQIASGADPALVVGEEVFAQYWMRDPALASTVALSDALAFRIGP